MSIYVAIILLSALSVFDDDHPPERGAVLLLELGTTVGLVLAHGFASWISTTVIGEESEEVDQWDLLRVQLVGAVGIAALAMIAVLIVADLDRVGRRPLHGRRDDRCARVRREPVEQLAPARGLRALGPDRGRLRRCDQVGPGALTADELEGGSAGPLFSCGGGGFRRCGRWFRRPSGGSCGRRVRCRWWWGRV